MQEEKIPCDSNRNKKSLVYERRRYTDTSNKAVTNEASVKARELRREQERRENEPVQEAKRGKPIAQHRIVRSGRTA
jgi:hypothetical protein